MRMRDDWQRCGDLSHRRREARALGRADPTSVGGAWALAGNDSLFGNIISSAAR